MNIFKKNFKEMSYNNGKRYNGGYNRNYNGNRGGDNKKYNRNYKKKIKSEQSDKGFAYLIKAREEHLLRNITMI